MINHLTHNIIHFTCLYPLYLCIINMIRISMYLDTQQTLTRTLFMYYKHDQNMYCRPIRKNFFIYIGLFDMTMTISSCDNKQKHDNKVSSILYLLCSQHRRRSIPATEMKRDRFEPRPKWSATELSRDRNEARPKWGATEMIGIRLIDCCMPTWCMSGNVNHWRLRKTKRLIL